MKKKHKVFIVICIMVFIPLFAVLYHLNLSFHLLGTFQGTDWDSYSFTYYDRTEIEEAFLHIRYYNPFTKEIRGLFYYSATGEYTYYHNGKYRTDPYSEHLSTDRFTSQFDPKSLTMKIECNSGQIVQLSYDIDYGCWEYNDIILY